MRQKKYGFSSSTEVALKNIDMFRTRPDLDNAYIKLTTLFPFYCNSTIFPWITEIFFKKKNNYFIDYFIANRVPSRSQYLRRKDSRFLWMIENQKHYIDRYTKKQYLKQDDGFYLDLLERKKFKYQWSHYCSNNYSWAIYLQLEQIYRNKRLKEFILDREEDDDYELTKDIVVPFKVRSLLQFPNIKHDYNNFQISGKMVRWPLNKFFTKRRERIRPKKKNKSPKNKHVWLKWFRFLYRKKFYKNRKLILNSFQKRKKDFTKNIKNRKHNFWKKQLKREVLFSSAYKQAEKRSKFYKKLLKWTTPYYKTFNWAPITVIKKPHWVWSEDHDWAEFCAKLPAPKDLVRYEHKNIYDTSRWIRSQIRFWAKWGRPKDSHIRAKWHIVPWLRPQTAFYKTPKIKTDLKFKYNIFDEEKYNLTKKKRVVMTRNKESFHESIHKTHINDFLHGARVMKHDPRTYTNRGFKNWLRNIEKVHVIKNVPLKRDNPIFKKKYFIYKNHKLNFWFEHFTSDSRKYARHFYLEKRATKWPVWGCSGSLDFSDNTFYEEEDFSNIDYNSMSNDYIVTFSDSDSDQEEFKYKHDARNIAYRLQQLYLNKKFKNIKRRLKLVERYHKSIHKIRMSDFLRGARVMKHDPRTYTNRMFKDWLQMTLTKTAHKKVYLKKRALFKKRLKHRFFIRRFLRRHAWEWKRYPNPNNKRPHHFDVGLKDLCHVLHDIDEIDKYAPREKPYPYRNINDLINNKRDYLVPEDEFYTDFKFSGDAVGNKKKKYVKDTVNSQIEFINDDIINLKIRRKNRFLKRRIAFFNKLIFAKRSRKKKYSHLSTEGLRLKDSFNFGDDTILRDILPYLPYSNKFEFIKIFILDNLEIPLFHSRILSRLYLAFEIGLNLPQKSSIISSLYDNLKFISNFTDWVVKTILILLNNNFFIYFWHFLARWVHIDYSARYLKFLQLNRFNGTNNIFNLEKYNFIFFKLIGKALFFLFSVIYFLYTIVICFLQNLLLENYSFIMDVLNIFKFW